MIKKEYAISNEEQRIREFETRIRRIVLGLAKKMTKANIRIDEILKTQKMLKEGYEGIEDVLYKYVLGSLPENDDTPNEEIAEHISEEVDEKKVLENIQTKGVLDTGDAHRIGKIQIAEKNKKTWKEINNNEKKKHDDKICLSCRHKIWEYSTKNNETISICNNKKSQLYQKEVQYQGTCKQWEMSSYHCVDPFNFYSKKCGKHNTVFNKKILAIDLLSNTTILKDVK